jgi:hypothetical protein
MAVGGVVVLVLVVDFVIVVVFVLADLRQISTCHLDAVSLFCP